MKDDIDITYNMLSRPPNMQYAMTQTTVSVPTSALDDRTQGFASLPIARGISQPLDLWANLKPICMDTATQTPIKDPWASHNVHAQTDLAYGGIEILIDAVGGMPMLVGSPQGRESTEVRTQTDPVLIIGSCAMDSQTLVTVTREYQTRRLL
jgi:hypothetical protein